MSIDVRWVTPLLQVFDMPTSVAFYRDVLGFDVVDSSSPSPEDRYDWALLSHGGTNIMLNTAYEADQRPPAPDPARVAAHGDTALFFGCPDVDGAYAYLRSRGVEAEPPKTAPYGMRQLYLKDPDGYTLCFQWPDSQETRDAWRERYGFDPENVARKA
jgi:catechol 2,3-dioxygenase-like lactoylglutathione lyase family enzyme